MNVQFLYGTRTIAGRDHEILLVDAGGIAGHVINSFKFYLWQRWGLDCGKHEGNWEFSFFLNAGEPLYAGLQAITQDMPPGRHPLPDRARVAGAAGDLQRAAPGRLLLPDDLLRA